MKVYFNNSCKICKAEIDLYKKENIEEILDNSYKEGDTLSISTLKFINSLFSEHGLIIIDANKKDLKSLFTDQLKNEIDNFSCKENTSSQISELKKDFESYKVQVNPSDINFFKLTDKGRKRIRYDKNIPNSFDVAKNYLQESKENVLSDVILMSAGLNQVSNLFYSNIDRFKNILIAEKRIRKIDDVYLIDSSGNIILSDLSDPDTKFIVPTEFEFNESIKGNAVFVSRELENKTSVMLKLNSLVDTYLLISRYIDLETCLLR